MTLKRICNFWVGVLASNKETIVYSRRAKSKSNETLTFEALKELEPVIVPIP